MKELLKKVKFNEKGLIPAILQDKTSKEVLMLAYMNKESLQKTIESGKACFWSRSREELWLKGETSGNYQKVEEIRFDCDNDTLLILVNPAGPACHTGRKSCFYQKISGDNIIEIDEKSLAGGSESGDTEIGEKTSEEAAIGVKQEDLEKASFLFKLYKLIDSRKDNPVDGSYTNYLFDKGVDKICKKVGEEAAEVIIGAKNADNDEMVYEIGDLIYHLLVLMNLYEIPLTDILDELEGRSK